MAQYLPPKSIIYSWSWVLLIWNFFEWAQHFRVYHLSSSFWIFLFKTFFHFYYFLLFIFKKNFHLFLIFWKFISWKKIIYKSFFFQKNFPFFFFLQNKILLYPNLSLYVCETPSLRLEPRPLPPTLHKHLYLWSDHRTKSVSWFKKSFFHTCVCIFLPYSFTFHFIVVLLWIWVRVACLYIRSHLLFSVLNIS